MFRPLKDSNKHKDIPTCGPIPVTNSRKPIFKAKRFLLSGTTTRAESIASARDLEECLESSVERKDSNLFSDRESPRHKSPKLKLSIDEKVKKNLNFNSSELENSFSLLMTPLSFEKFGKRKTREDGEVIEGKRIKKDRGVEMRKLKELIDPEDGMSEYYRVYVEEDVVGDREIRENLIKNEIDEDCPTSDSQIDICVEYLAAQVEEAILNEN